ncbi:hypothetical protein KI387_023709, partial [Taxus chinensis]
DLSQVWATTLVARYKMINRALGEVDSYEEHISKMQGDANNEIQKLGVSVVGENTSTDDFLKPFEDLVKKEAEDLFSFNKDTLKSLPKIRVVIYNTARDHQSWFMECKNIKYLYENWVKSLSFVHIPRVDKVTLATTRYNKEFKGIEISLEELSKSPL